MVAFTSQEWPTRVGEVPLQIRELFDAPGHLSISSDLLTYDDRIVIPVVMREEILERIHAGHQSVTKSCEHANLSVWLLGVSKEIMETVESCQFCQQHQPSQGKEPMITTVLPDRPWQNVSIKFALASWSEIPSGNGLLFKVH